MLNGMRHVTEGTTFKYFLCEKRGHRHSPARIGILDGVTRRLVIQCARQLGYPVREVRFPKERLYEADEVFMSSSVKEVFPVTRIDNKRIGKGVAGSVTLALQEAYAKARKK